MLQLPDETAAARSELAKQHASDLLGSPIKDIYGHTYYMPHVSEVETKPAGVDVILS
jgi:hypothetical protein